MKEFVEKLIGRLEEYKYSHLVERDSESVKHCVENEKHCEGNDCILCVWDKSIEIVNQLAEEYNNGWIAVSERLPEKEVDVLVCFSNDMDCVIAYRTKMMNTNLKEVWVNSSTAHIISSNIIAWQPLPAPFKKGE